MHVDRSVALACGGLLAMAAALGIGRFVYTPILPDMLSALDWSKSDAGLVASANFLGYLIGALMAAQSAVAARPRFWLLAALTVSAASTAAMALPSWLLSFVALRLIGGFASAFVIVCASTIILGRLTASGRGSLSALHFAGVGVGIFISAAAVTAMQHAGAGWRLLWIGSGMIATLALICVALLVPANGVAQAQAALRATSRPTPGLWSIIAAYGLFGFGYVITATFLVAIVRSNPEIRALEPWVWMLFGLAAIPSVAVWCWLGEHIGLTSAFAAACLVQALGVAASVEGTSIQSLCMSAVMLGGTFMGQTALGLMIGRNLAGEASHKTIASMTASFGVGQMIAPLLAGLLFDRFGSFRVASFMAVVALLFAAGLAVWTGMRGARNQAIANAAGATIRQAR